MTAPVTVTPADREAAAKWAKAQSRHAQAANMLRGSCDTAPLVQAFARHRTQSAAASSAQVAELREALGWYADTFCEGFGECVGDTCGKWSDDQCSGCKAFAILARAKSASDAEGV